MQPLLDRLPRVSVLMAVHNTAAFLADALASIARQSFADFEFVIVDDGSTDGSAALLQAHAAGDPRVRLTVRENQGLVATRNELLGSARGELIAWMDSDDLSLPNRLAVQVRAFDADAGLVCLGSAAQCIDPEGNPLNIERYPLGHDDIVAGQLSGGAMRFPTSMMRRELAVSVGGFRAPFRIGEDLDLFFRLSEVGKMANLEDVLYLYRLHLSSTAARLTTEWHNYRDEIFALARERRELGSDRLQRGETVVIPSVRRFDDRFVVPDTYVRWARHAAENGNRGLAYRYAKAAFAHRPLAPRYWPTLIGARLRAWWP